MPDREVVSILGNGGRDATVESSHDLFEIDVRQRLPDLDVRVLVVGVEVGAHGTAEQHRILRNSGNASTYIVKSQLEDVDAIEEDAAFVRLDEAEEGDDERALSASGAADDANLVT